MSGLIADCRHAVRLYLRTPGASLIAVAVLAVGLAFVAAIVSLYVDLTLKPHPGFEDGGRIVSYGADPNSTRIRADLIERIAEESATLEAAAGTASFAFRVGRDGVPAVGEVVTREFFNGLRPRLALGRGFDAVEHAADGDRVVVISYRYWREALGGREDVLGTTLAVTGRGPGGAAEQAGGGERWTDLRIVGVMAPELTATASSRIGDETTFWVPLERGLHPEGDPDRAFGGILMTGLALRAHGMSTAAVARELAGRGYTFPDSLSGSTQSDDIQFGVFDGVVFEPGIQRSIRRQLRLFLAASLLLALVAAANVSLFLLARAPGRQRELGIRMAVGAPLKRLARQLASEASLLVAAGALLGLALSIWLAQFLQGLEFLRRAQWLDVTLLDWRVLAITSACLAVLTLLVSLAPIVGLRKMGIDASSRQVSARTGIAQRIAGNAQLAIAGALGGAGVAFTWYLGSLLLGHPGYETRDLHVARYSIDYAAYWEGGQPFESYFVDQTRRRETIESLPGVTGVSLTSAVPGMRGGVYTAYMRDSDNPEDPTATTSLPMIRIDGGYVDLLGLRLLHGRSPETSEPTAILVNQSLAHSVWGREEVVGEHLPLATFAGPSSEVVGVLADLPYEHPSAEASPLGFATVGQQFFSEIALVRSADSSAALRRQLQGLVDSGALELTLDDVTPLAMLRNDVLAADRARGLLTIATATLAVLLAAFGSYGTQRYLVTAGRREYAIRASLGAGPRAVGRLVVRRGLLLGLPGLATGGLLAFIVVAWIRDDYVSREVSPALVTIAVVAGVTLLLFTASAAPARAARRAQPATLLREE